MAIRVTSPKDQKRMASIWGVMPDWARAARQPNSAKATASETKNGRIERRGRARSSMLCSTDSVGLRCNRDGREAASGWTLAVEDKGIQLEGHMRQNRRSLFVR